MLDVHILISKDTRPEWVGECLLSVHAAVEQAGYPVNVHTLPGVPGHIGRGRAAGYAMGSGRWKTYVDDDDYLPLHAFKALGQYLDSEVAVIFPREQVEQNGKLHSFTVPRHHLITYQADVVQLVNHEDWAAMGDVRLSQLARNDPRGFLELDDALYVNRVYYASRGRVLRKQHQHESARCRELK